ncbi:MAG TPA: hypothetical protein VN622_00790 [Clostridia bacterium]|nr:hypothetical protein [Clostridia bacterium]
MENQYEELHTSLVAHLLDLLRENFGELLVSVSLGRDRKRDVILKVGKSEKFTIPEKDIP